MRGKKDNKNQKSRRPYAKSVKHYGKRKNRQATREALHHKKYDKFGQKRVKDEDSWGWD